MKSKAKLVSILLVVVLVIGSIPMSKLLSHAAEGDTVLKEYTFDSSTQDWTARGEETVEYTDEVGHNKAGALSITGRTESWNGTTADLTSYLEDGKTYKFSMWVMFNGNNAPSQQNMSLSIAYTASGSSESYANLTSATVNKGQWTKIEGTYTYSSTVEQLKAYVEGGTMDFYVDDITVSEKADLPIEEDIPSLKDAYSDYFKIGTGVTANSLNGTERAIIKKHFNSLTCGNEMKPDALLDHDAMAAALEETGDESVVKISLAQAAPILKFAADNNIAMRGHTFAWHSQTPRWFFAEGYSQDGNAPLVSKEVMLKRLENYIKTVFETVEKEYPTIDFYAWDVVNEAVDPNQADGYRRPNTGYTTDNDASYWMGVVGEEFIEKAFEYARKYAPAGTLLAYNDYNECESVKSDYIYKICEKLVAQGNLDVVGMQQHNDVNYPSSYDFEKAIRKYAKLGVKIQVTEMDFTTSDSSQNGLKVQGEKYKAFFDVLKKLKDEGIDIDAVVIWGVSDLNSWRGTQYPLLFDAEYKAKPAFWGVLGDLATATAKPSVSPTATAKPTEKPTTAPTATAKPTEEPTVAPTETAQPTEKPTATPAQTANPSENCPTVTVKASAGSNLSAEFNVKDINDVSKLELRCEYEKDGSATDIFVCNNAGINYRVSPWYANYTQNVTGKVENNCFTIRFADAADLSNGNGTLNFSIMLHQDNWTSYKDFKLTNVKMYVDGEYVGDATIN